MRMLTRGFHMIERRHALALKTVKAQLPRRESERRYHPLARHCDILTSIETRISMLNMTYLKYIDNQMCCFIPGKVIDEIRRVLTIVETSKTPPRAHEVLQELRDISSMAIEHFDEKISPAFRKRMQDCTVIDSAPRPAHVTVLAPIAMHKEMLHLRRRSILNAKLSLYLATLYKKMHKRTLEYKRVAWQQRKTIRDLAKRQRTQESAIAELKKRVEECDIKYSELTHTNQAVGGKVITATPVNDNPSSSQPLRHFGSQIKLDLSVLPIGTSKRNQKLLPNIKPRKPQIKLPSLAEENQETKDGQPSPVPSTSANQSPKFIAHSAIAKIRGITEQIRHLSNLSKSLDGKLKRPHILDYKEPECKKPKLD
ncbi:F-box only protein 28 isoform X2 [Battus philenor]